MCRLSQTPTTIPVEIVVPKRNSKNVGLLPSFILGDDAVFATSQSGQIHTQCVLPKLTCALIEGERRGNDRKEPPIVQLWINFPLYTARKMGSFES